MLISTFTSKRLFLLLLHLLLTSTLAKHSFSTNNLKAMLMRAFNTKRPILLLLHPRLDTIRLRVGQAT